MPVSGRGCGMDKTKRARTLRRRHTAAERLLWAQLRDLRLYVADFVCLEGKLIVEVDGEPHELTVAHDMVRDAKLRAAGYRVLRFRNDEVRSNLDGVCQSIRNVLTA